MSSGALLGRYWFGCRALGTWLPEGNHGLVLAGPSFQGTGVPLQRVQEDQGLAENTQPSADTSELPPLSLLSPGSP